MVSALGLIPSARFSDKDNGKASRGGLDLSNRGGSRARETGQLDPRPPAGMCTSDPGAPAAHCCPHRPAAGAGVQGTMQGCFQSSTLGQPPGPFSPR